MPRVISVNSHRFPGPNQYYAGPSPAVSTWVQVSTGVLIIPFPAWNVTNLSPGVGARYDITTNTVTTQNYAFNTYPNIEDGGGPTQTFRKGYFCSLGGGFALVGRIDTASGTGAPSRAWVYSDQTRSFTAINGPGFILSEGSPAPTMGAYYLGPNLGYVEGNGQAFVYNRINNTWSSAAGLTSVWTGGRISDGLLYLAGKVNESNAGINTYTAQSAQSFVYNHSANTVTALGHGLELKVPPTEDFGGTRRVLTRSGQMQNFANDGIIALGANNNWLVYRHSTGSIISRPRTYTPNYIALLRSDPLTYVLDTPTSSDYVYSW